MGSGGGTDPFRTDDDVSFSGVADGESVNGETTHTRTATALSADARENSQQRSAEPPPHDVTGCVGRRPHSDGRDRVLNVVLHLRHRVGRLRARIPGTNITRRRQPGMSHERRRGDAGGRRGRSRSCLSVCRRNSLDVQVLVLAVREDIGVLHVFVVVGEDDRWQRFGANRSLLWYRRIRLMKSGRVRYGDAGAIKTINGV